MRGTWLITQGESFITSFGPTHSLFKNGLLRVAYGVNRQYGYAMVWDYPTGNWGQGADSAIQVDGEETARRVCLDIAGLTPDHVRLERAIDDAGPTAPAPTTEIPSSILKSFDLE